MEEFIKRWNYNALDERNDIISFISFGNSFSLTTCILLLIAAILFFYIYEKKKLNDVCLLILLASIFSVFLLGLLDRYNFATDRNNYLYYMPRFRENLFIEGTKDLLNMRSSNNASFMYSLLPLPSPRSLLDLALFVKCIYLAFVLILISKDFDKRKIMIYFVIFFPLFHYYSGFGSKECMVIALSFFWAESLINQKIILNIFTILIFILIKFEFGFLIAGFSLFFLVIHSNFLKNKILFKNIFLLLSIISLYLFSSYYYEIYEGYINHKFRGFHEDTEWVDIYSFTELLIRITMSYFISPMKIMNLENFKIFNLLFSISLILSYVYFYIEVIKIKKISYELIFIVLFKILFCGIYTLMIENWGTYQRLIFTPIVMSIFMTQQYSIFKKNEK